MRPRQTTESQGDDSADLAARRYEAANNRLFLLRILLTVLVTAAYLYSGASAKLAAGLHVRFDPIWPLVNAIYLLITLFGFSVLLFPLSLYGGYVLEHRYGLSHQDFGEWLSDHLKSLGLEIALGALFFEAIYVFLAWIPSWWWMAATFFYILFAVVLTALAPVVILPLFHSLEPLDDPTLTSALRDFMQKAGLEIVGVFRWGLEETTSAANAALAGLGRTRRIILADTMLEGYSHHEIMAVLAHEVGHFKHKDLVRLTIVSGLLACAGFYLADICLRALVHDLGFAGIADIGSFPVFVFCLFVFSLVCMPLANAYSRRREFAADEYAIRSMQTARPLVEALEKLARQNLSDRDPAAWLEFLVHSHPSVARRVRRAQIIEAEVAPSVSEADTKGAG